MSFIEIKKLTKIYRSGDGETKALNNVNFSLEEGAFCVVLGQSGAGKTTLLNMLGRMDSPTSGSIEIGDGTLSTMNEKGLTEFRRKHVGFVFQSYNIIPNLTVLENVKMVNDFGGRGCGLDPLVVLRDVGLSEKVNDFANELSGGQLQRVAIARAVCKNPDLLLCDEPTGALDSKTGQSVLALLKRMAAQYHKTVIVVTHNSIIARSANVVVTIKDGAVESIAYNDNPSDVSEIEW